MTVKYRLRTNGHFESSGDVSVNVYHMEITSGVGPTTPAETILSLARGFWVQAYNVGLLTLIVSDFKFDSVDVQEISGGSNAGMELQYIIPSDRRTGLATGDRMPTFAAYGMRFQRPSNEYRHGYKRIAGVPEAMSTNGFVTDSAVSTLQSFGDILLEGFTLYNDSLAPYLASNARYVLQRKQNSGVMLPEPIYASPSAVVIQPRITTQNSRKVGRGS